MPETFGFGYLKFINEGGNTFSIGVNIPDAVMNNEQKLMKTMNILKYKISERKKKPEVLVTVYTFHSLLLTFFTRKKLYI